jgi:hypothetical protein
MKLDVEMHFLIAMGKPKSMKRETLTNNEPKNQSEVFAIEPNFSNCLTSATTSLSNSTNCMNLHEEEEKIEAQILAAKRSLITNLVLSALCVLTNSAFIFLPLDLISYFIVLVLSFLKGALPVSTTMVNFGTVANVISMYLNYFEK